MFECTVQSCSNVLLQLHPLKLRWSVEVRSESIFIFIRFVWSFPVCPSPVLNLLFMWRRVNISPQNCTIRTAYTSLQFESESSANPRRLEQSPRLCVTPSSAQCKELALQTQRRACFARCKSPRFEGAVKQAVIWGAPRGTRASFRDSARVLRVRGINRSRVEG